MNANASIETETRLNWSGELSVCVNAAQVQGQCSVRESADKFKLAVHADSYLYIAGFQLLDLKLEKWHCLGSIHSGESVGSV